MPRVLLIIDEFQEFFVKDDKIVRMTPIDLTDEDAPSYTIKARGKEFKPARRRRFGAVNACML